MHVLSVEETAATLRAYGLDQPSGLGFAFRDRAHNTIYDWHAHTYHQILYAAAGTIRLETDTGRFFLPPQRAAWIPAGIGHRTWIDEFDGASVYLRPDLVEDPGDRVRIVTVTPVMREMVLHALRWPRGAAEVQVVAASFFSTLALMCSEWIDAELPLWLSTSSHPGVRRAMDLALANPGAATVAQAAAAAHASERTFRRLFSRETGMTWQTWIGQARIIASTAGLARGERVTEVAAAAGFASLSAFAKAFARLHGESPSTFRRRF